MGKLPDELADLASLEILDISHNSFISLPTVVFKMPKLRRLMANDNKIIGKDSRGFQETPPEINDFPIFRIFRYRHR